MFNYWLVLHNEMKIRQQIQTHLYIALIILYMLTITTYSILCVLAFTATEITNFDYTNHGDDWNSCPKNGSRQSPILLHLSEKIQKSKDSYVIGDYFQTKGVANYLNTTIYINTTDNFGSISTKLIDGVSLPFKATQIRVRMHSEHKTQQGYYDLELQIFHTQLYQTSRNYRLAVSLLFNVGETQDQFVAQILGGYNRNKTSAEIEFDLRSYIPKNVVQDFWFYNGSPTIPGCTDSKLHWIVIRKIHSISADQKHKLEQILSQGKEGWPGNWRNTQAQNSNIVGFRQVEPLSEM